MTWQRLLHWDAIQRRRRGAARPWIIAAGLGALFAGALSIIGYTADATEARGWWLVLAVIGCATIVMSTPWRFYWRADSALLARLPIPGGALYRLGLWRSLLAAVEVALVLLAAAVPAFAPAGIAAYGHAVQLVVAGTMLSALLAPPAAVVAGALVASDATQRAFSAMSGEGAPKVVWLSFVPALGGAVVGAFVFELAADVDALILSGGLVGAGLLLLAFAPLAHRALPLATREVAALDQVRLAHVELDTARGLERVWGRVAGAGARVYAKDVALARRRYPAYYLWVGAAIIASWVVAIFVDEPTRSHWLLPLACGIAAYTVIFSRRLVMPPIEHPRLLRILPLPRGAATRAKAAYIAWRAVVPLALAAGPALYRSPTPAHLAEVLLALAGLTVLLGLVAQSQSGDSQP